MIEISSKYGAIEIGHLSNSSLRKFIVSKSKDTKFAVLVDENTKKECLPYFLTCFPFLNNAKIIETVSGEENKSLSTCEKIWEEITRFQFRRKDVLINLGGGLITDLGGFAASSYKRGIDFINIPTTLLGMVDASIGGKTGVNFGGYKNQIGMFSNSVLTICDPFFLNSLPEKELLSGKAEMLKHGLIFSDTFFDNMITNNKSIPSETQILTAINIKSKIVGEDLWEKGERKKLNFGHTVGHALEEFLLEKKATIPHGICIAWGMLAESYLSHQFAGLSSAEFEKIDSVIRDFYEELPLNIIDFKTLITFMQQDKKNESTTINFTLLENIGVARINFELTKEEVYSALLKVFS